MQFDDEDQQQQPVGPQPRRTSRSNYVTSTAAAKSKPKIDVPKLAKKPTSLSTNTGPPDNSAGDLKKDDGCMVCHRDVDHANLLLCEACNDEYHTYCLNPPLQSVPEGDFFCGKIFVLTSVNFILQGLFIFIRLPTSQTNANEFMTLEMMTGLIRWYQHYHLRSLPDSVK